MFTFIYLIVISLSGYYLLTPFFRRELPLPVGFSSDGTQTLIHEKQLLLTELQEIEFDYNMGKLSDTDYAALTKEYKLRTAAVLKQLESRAQPSKKARKKGTKCPACGAAYTPGNKYCSTCGARLEGGRS